MLFFVLPAGSESTTGGDASCRTGRKLRCLRVSPRPRSPAFKSARPDTNPKDGRDNPYTLPQTNENYAYGRRLAASQREVHLNLRLDFDRLTV